MDRFPDLRVLWWMGAAILIFCTVGVAGAGSIAALPLYLAVFAGMSQETAFQIFLYSALLWAPVGAGMGTMGVTVLVRGLRRKSQPEGERVVPKSS